MLVSSFANIRTRVVFTLTLATHTDTLAATPASNWALLLHWSALPHKLVATEEHRKRATNRWYSIVKTPSKNRSPKPEMQSRWRESNPLHRFGRPEFCQNTSPWEELRIENEELRIKNRCLPSAPSTQLSILNSKRPSGGNRTRAADMACQRATTTPHLESRLYG